MRMKWCKLVPLLLVVLIRHVQLESFHISEDDCKQCELEPHIKCTYEDVRCEGLVYNPDYMSHLWPGPPSEFFAQTYDRGSSVGLNFTWKPPADASLHHVKGFFLKLIDLEGVSECVLVNLTGTEWQGIAQDSEILFHYSCFTSVKYGGSYYAMIESFPLPEQGFLFPNYKDLFLYTPNRPLDDSIPADWSPSIVQFAVTNDTEGSRVQVHFDSAPSEFKFTEYTVALNEKNSKEKDQTQQVVVKSNFDDRVTVYFEKVCRGQYRIQIQPKHIVNDECVCGVHGFVNCAFCLLTQTRLIYVEPALPCEADRPPVQPDEPTTLITLLKTSQLPESDTPASQNSGPDNPDTILPILITVFAVFAGISLLVVALVVAIICRKPRHQDKNNNRPITNQNGYAGNNDDIPTIVQFHGGTLDTGSVSLYNESGCTNYIIPPRNPSEFIDKHSDYMTLENEKQSQLFNVETSSEVNCTSSPSNNEVLKDAKMAKESEDEKAASDKEISCITQIGDKSSHDAQKDNIGFEI